MIGEDGGPLASQFYREVVLDHARRPRRAGEVEEATDRAEGEKPLCGDRVEIEARVDGGRVADIAVRTHGCAISTAAGSMLAEALAGASSEQACALLDELTAVLEGEREPAPEHGDFAALAGVRHLPMRLKCALLPLEVARQVLGCEPARMRSQTT